VIMKKLLTAERLSFLFRLLVIGCQAVTILLTWELWQNRTMPPLLPALPLPPVDMAVLLLLSLVVVIVRPRVGLIAHSLLLAYAMLTDQTRLQPEFISMAILMWGTLNNPTAKTITRTHLIAMWTWAGVNKLLSPVFIASTGPAMMRPLLGFMPEWFIGSGGWIIALTEITLGVLFLIPRTRRPAAVLAFALHTGILLTLTVGLRYNSAVWGWNVALAFAGFYYGWNWRESPLAVMRAARPLIIGVILFMVISPIGFYVGIFDAYLSYNLYSSNTADANARISPDMTMPALNVPFPPEHRLFEQFFQTTCAPGDLMTIQDSRPYFAARNLNERVISCDG